MLQTIDIPGPSGADAENVVTALETAAIFGARGDAHEAMHWLRRAAEAAGDAGDDERALSLSRIAADLHDEVSGTRPIASPTPPPSARVSQPSPPSVSYPPPPSSRSARPPSTMPRPSQVPRPSAPPASVAASRPPVALVPTQPVAEAARVAPPDAAPPTPPPLPLPEVAPVPAAVVAAPPPASARPTTAVVEAPPPTSVRPTTSSTGARHAARVAVSISTTKVGCLEVRLLNEGEAPRIGSSEALLVMLDPTSTLLAR